MIIYEFVSAKDRDLDILNVRRIPEERLKGKYCLAFFIDSAELQYYPRSFISKEFGWLQDKSQTQIKHNPMKGKFPGGQLILKVGMQKFRLWFIFSVYISVE
ncbi:MAG TPA: hypothetical protein DHV28_08555 [Ignavibacteriales bacterium]|nr:hypothetical protein [Ignavibacteriales bacterium]